MALPAAVRATDGPAPVPARQRRLGDGIGLNVKFSQGQSLRDLSLLPELGVRWVRDFLPWRLVEPQAGRSAAGPVAWRERLAFYKAHDIGVVCLLALSNEAAYPPNAEAPLRHTDPGAFADHALAMARMLQQAGVRFVLEIGNEPHNGFLHKLLGGDWSGRPPSPWLDHYVRLVHAAVTRVKAFDPTIRLLTDDDMWIVHHRYLDAGLPPALDGFAVHPYDPHGPEITTSPDGAWMRPHRIADNDRSLTSAVRRLRERGLQELKHRPDIWFTEWGWPLVGKQTGRVLSEALQAARLPRAFIVAEAAGVEALCWYSSHDAGEGSYGLIGQRGQRRPAFDAMVTLSRELGDWTLAAQVIGAQQPTTGLQGFLFRRDGRAKLALWNADEVDRAVALAGPLRTARGVDGLGQRLAVSEDRTSDQPWALRVGALPLYLDGFDAAAVGDNWAAHVE